MEDIFFTILVLFIGMVSGSLSMMAINYLKKENANKNADKIINDAKKEAEKKKRDLVLELKEESYKQKQELDKEIKERKSEVKTQEERLDNREKSLDKREELIQNRDEMLDKKDMQISNKQKEIQDKQLEIEETLRKEIETLESISKLSKEKAHDMIMKKVENTMSREIAEYIKEKESEAKLTASEKAKQVIVSSMQRYSNDVTNEKTVNTISLPSDEMKGRLIGREGRNIRTIEAVTGVDLIIDDTPEAIVISSFDPLRREIAKTTIETLIKDGRIHPTRIEEVHDKVVNDIQQKMIELGNEAVFEAGLTKVDVELVKLIGRLHFRTSYGQNVLQHSLEVSHLTGLMAQELGENVALAKRAGLLHDIGKAIDYEIEGSHVELGKDLAEKFGEDEVVINAIMSHHGDYDATSIISVLVQIADTLSAGRPGARNDSLENYIKRLTQLENLGQEIKGVEKAYALQAGREIRMVVKPDEVDDLKSIQIARDMKEKVETNMQYPGTIKITVIRETRHQEEAK